MKYIPNHKNSKKDRKLGNLVIQREKLEMQLIILRQNKTFENGDNIASIFKIKDQIQIIDENIKKINQSMTITYKLND